MACLLRRTASCFALLAQTSVYIRDGLSHFIVPEDRDRQLPPELWPRLSVAPDQGGDGVCALNFATRRLRMNIDITFDPSHGLNNDIWLAFSDVGLRAEMLLWLVCFNVAHGPWSEETRYVQCKQAMQDRFAITSRRPYHRLVKNPRQYHGHRHHHPGRIVHVLGVLRRR